MTTSETLLKIGTWVIFYDPLIGGPENPGLRRIVDVVTHTSDGHTEYHLDNMRRVLRSHLTELVTK